MGPTNEEATRSDDADGRVKKAKKVARVVRGAEQRGRTLDQVVD